MGSRRPRTPKRPICCLSAWMLAFHVLVSFWSTTIYGSKQTQVEGVSTWDSSNVRFHAESEVAVHDTARGVSRCTDGSQKSSRGLWALLAAFSGVRH